MAEDKDDDLRSTIAAAFEESASKGANDGQSDGASSDESTDRVERPDSAAPESEDAKAERTRDEAGRFAKEEKKRETLKLKEQPAGKVPPDSPAKAPEAPAVDPNKGTAEAAPDYVAAPAQWLGSDKLDWHRLPKNIKVAVKAEFDRAAQMREAVEPIMRTLEPARELLMREGGSVEGGVQKLIQISDWAARQPEEFLVTFARQRGLNFPALAAKLGFQVVQAAPNGAPQPIAAQPPAIPHEVSQRIAQLEQTLRGQQDAGIQSQIQAFVDDPAHPYVADVQNEMIADIERQKRLGQRPNLKEAYDRAVWANPATRAQMSASQQQPQGKPDPQAVEAARAAKGASLNGSPVPSAGTAGSKDEDLRSTIARQVYASVGGQRI